MGFTHLPNLPVTLIEITLLQLTLLGGSVVISTLKVGISPMPSSSKTRKEILKCCKNTGTGPTYELGCGWGNLLIALAKRYPNRQIVGYELSLLPWFTCLCLIKLFRLHNVQLYWENFFKADLSQVKVIYYLYPKGMQKLDEKLSSYEIKPDYLISNTFALPSQQPQKTIRLEDLYRSPVYLYQLNRNLK